MAIARRQLHEAQPVTIRVQSHGLGIHGDDRSKGQIIRQIVAMQMDGTAGYELRAAHCIGAQEKTRTSTTLRPQVPETCASTNSATWATRPPAAIAGLAVGRGM